MSASPLQIFAPKGCQWILLDLRLNVLPFLHFVLHPFPRYNWKFVGGGKLLYFFRYQHSNYYIVEIHMLNQKSVCLFGALTHGVCQFSKSFCMDLHITHHKDAHHTLQKHTWQRCTMHCENPAFISMVSYQKGVSAKMTKSTFWLIVVVTLYTMSYKDPRIENWKRGCSND